jgi:hypothetical protein
MGKGKKIKNAKYVDLTKLLYNHMNKPMVGIRYDRTVVSNFIPAYMPKSHRLSLCELGDLNKETLFKILKRYDTERYRVRTCEERALRSLIDDMGSYPFVIENPNQFNWNNSALKGKKKEIINNTVNAIVGGLDKFYKSICDNNTRLISVDGNLQHDVNFSRMSKEGIKSFKEICRRIYEENVEIRNGRISRENANRSQFFKFWLLLESRQEDAPKLPNNSLPEDEDGWRKEIKDLVKVGIAERLFIQ